MPKSFFVNNCAAQGGGVFSRLAFSEIQQGGITGEEIVLVVPSEMLPELEKLIQKLQNPAPPLIAN